MTFQCYVSRSSQHARIGAVFVTPEGLRRMVPDHWLAQAELLEQGRLLRLIYTHCTMEVAGQHLEPLFEDAVAGRLGTVCQSNSQSQPSDGPWVGSLVALAAGEAVPARQRGSL